MWDHFEAVLLEFKWIIILVVAVGIAVTAVAMRLSEGLKWNQRRWKFLGIFAGLRTNELFCLAFLMVRYVFSFAIVVFGVKLSSEHFYCYVVLTLGCVLLIPHVKRMALDVVNSVVIYASLLVSNMLQGYLKEIRSDVFVRIILILLAVFLIVYTTYFLFKDLADMLKDKKKQRVKNEAGR